MKVSCDIRRTEIRPAMQSLLMALLMALLMGVLALGVLTGCQTASLEDAAPKTAPGTLSQPTEAGGKKPEPEKKGIAVLSPIPVPFNRTEKIERKQFVEAGIASDGEFPNLGTERTAALPQLTQAETTAMKKEFSSVTPKGGNGTQSNADYRRRLIELRRIAKTHASETEAEITK